jgi:hypothetical protein
MPQGVPIRKDHRLLEDGRVYGTKLKVFSKEFPNLNFCNEHREIGNHYRPSFATQKTNATAPQSNVAATTPGHGYPPPQAKKRQIKGNKTRNALNISISGFVIV